MIAKAVASLTLRAIAYADWYRLEQRLSHKMYKMLQDRVFTSVAKFVLSVFDMEDFERIYRRVAVVHEFESFYSDLCKFESDCNPVIAITEGRMKLDKFSVLREHDVGDILWQYQIDVDSGNKFCPVCPKLFSYFPIEWDDISQYHVRSAMRAMKNYVPLKEDCKMQLTLELARGKCFYIIDTLYLEVWKDIKIDEFFRHFADKWEDELYDLAKALHGGLYSLSEMKQSMLWHFQHVVTFPLSYGVFGPCTDEVIEVVRVADHFRRMQGHRFISVHHILSGLSQTRVGDCVKRVNYDRARFSEEPSNSPVYNIYKLSQDVARFLGHEEMGLEDLILAVNRSQALNGGTSLTIGDNVLDAELLDCLKNGEEKRCAISWSVPDIWSTFLPEDCLDGGILACSSVFMVKKLSEAFESGFTLPDIR